jgi:uncharacterized membrane protein YfcA
MNLAIIALVAGGLIGLSLGALGGGGSILAVPVLVYALDQGPVEATTGSLVVVGVTSLAGTAVAWRTGRLLPGPGLAFGVVAIAGAAAGAVASTHVRGAVLLAAFAVLMLVIGAVMAWRQFHSFDDADTDRAFLTEPIITFRPSFACQCPRALKVLVSATAVGLMTGFLGVGGGFLVVPALLLALGLPMRYAVGTSLLVISMTSIAALLVRGGSDLQPDWRLVILLTAASAVGAVLGVRLAARVSPRTLSAAFTVLVLGVAAYTAWRALPAVI